MTKKKPNLKLFTKTWPKRKNEEDVENAERPNTATLEKPQILNIKFINKIDMSMIRKELLCITNLCRVPLTVTKLPKRMSFNSRRRKAIIARPLSLPSCEENVNVGMRTRRSETSEDSWESEESIISQARSAKTSKSGLKKIKPVALLTSSRRTIPELEKKSNKDSNNNPKLSKLNSKSAENNNANDNPKTQSIKLPEPCKTCGRPDQPERFHSHPVTALKPLKKVMETVRIPIIKSTVQKPFAMKYKSKISNYKPLPLPNQIVDKVNNKVQVERPKTGKGPKTLICYLCGREFGTASLKLHEPKCLVKWERENASLPPTQRRKLPKKPDSAMTKDEWNSNAWKANQASLVPCEKCNRTFLPDRLIVHQRSCKADPKGVNSSDPNAVLGSSRPPASPTAPPSSVECGICGRLFGQKSIKIHEPQCLKKWQQQNELLPIGKRPKVPLKSDKSTASLITPPQKPLPEMKPTERPSSAKKPNMLPCYLCGRLFGVTSIYIHEPQCLKKWIIENEKLSPSKRRPEPIKPDIKFTPDGKIDYDSMNETHWETHLSQLVPCNICGRTFNPDRVAVHERSCKG